MPNAQIETISYRDARGMTARTSFLCDSSLTVVETYTNALQVAQDLLAMTNAVQVAAHGPYTSDLASPTYGGVGQFQDVSDKATFSFADGAGRIHRLSLPAPKSALFMTDLETIDKTNALVKQFVADMLFVAFGGTAPTAGQSAAAVTASGSPLLVFLGGLRNRSRIARKLTIYTLIPAETGPAE